MPTEPTSAPALSADRPPLPRTPPTTPAWGTS